MQQIPSPNLKYAALASEASVEITAARLTENGMTAHIVQTVRADDMNIPPLAIHAVTNGEKAVEALVI